MSISDHIVVMDHGLIAQVGPPRELYDRPTSSFVMGFLGPVSRLGDRLVRPHDISVSLEPCEGATEAQVGRVVHLGFEVRIELLVEGDEPVFVQLTRHEAEQLELSEGDIVWLRASAGTPVAGQA